VILSIKAIRKSADVKDLPDAGAAHIQGSNILEFEVPYDGNAPTQIMDCESKHVFDMHQVRGEALPRRACPLRPKGVAPGPDGPPAAWLDPETGRIKRSMFASDDPKNAVTPKDLFAVVSVATCTTCDKASEGTVALKSERTAIGKAFHEQLQVEDFSGFPDITDEDRDQRRWSIHWNDVGIIQD